MQEEKKPKRNWLRYAFIGLATLLFSYWVSLGLDLVWQGRDETLVQLEGLDRCEPVALERPRFLLWIGADPNYTSSRFNWALLHRAAMAGQLELAGLLLDSGADPDLLTSDRDAPRTAIHLACLRDESSSGSAAYRNRCPERRLAVIELLLERGASADSMDASCEFYARFGGVAQAASLPD